MDRPTSIDNNELFLTNLNRRVAVPPFIMFRSIFDELSSFAKYNIYPNTLRTPQLVSREGTLEEDGSNLASVLKRINTAKRFGPNKDDILTGIRQIMPMISDFQIRSAAGFYVPVLRVTESSGEIHDFNLSQISDGTLRVLGLLAAFYQPFGPTKIGIEEPELMIHPGALQVVAEAIRDFTRERPDEDSRQAFITTHSPTFLDSFDPREIIWARFESGVTKSGTVSARQTELIKTQLFSPGEILLSEGFFS
jgi:predicted ATPase